MTGRRLSFRVADHGRDLHRQPLLPPEPRGRHLAFAILRSVLLWSLAVLAALHLAARILP